MTLEWEGEADDRIAARQALEEYELLVAHGVGEPITIANEFSEMRVQRVETRNGSRLLIESPRSGQWVAIDPIELESLTWQNPETFSAMIAHPFGPLFPDDRGVYGADPAKLEED